MFKGRDQGGRLNVVGHEKLRMVKKSGVIQGGTNVCLLLFVAPPQSNVLPGILGLVPACPQEKFKRRYHDRHGHQFSGNAP
jgi:hypothetical protein